MSQVRPLILPCDPEWKASILQENARRGFQNMPGLSDHEMGAQLRNDDPSAMVWTSFRTVIRPTVPCSARMQSRPSVIFGAVGVLAAVLGVMAR